MKVLLSNREFIIQTCTDNSSKIILLNYRISYDHILYVTLFKNNFWFINKFNKISLPDLN